MQTMIQGAEAAALVSRSGFADDAPAEYLVLSEGGAMRWVSNPAAATPFATMREAARMALRLPAALRAYGLRRDVELALARPDAS